MLDRESKTTSLQRIATKAGRDQTHRFGNLYGMLNEAMLYESWNGLNKRAAAGVDRMKPKEFEAGLAKNICQLAEDLKAKRYRAPLVRRKNIERPDGKLRPLGIPAVGDKVVQAGAARILEAIYEQDFLECSYGYRKGRSIHEAVKVVDRAIAFGGCEWVVEADISGFFNHLDHEWLTRMLRERVADKAFPEADQQMAKGRSAGGRRKDHPPGEWDATRRGHLAGAGQRVSALRLGPLVRA
jgi:RNA-directed DNA polymerase